MAEETLQSALENLSGKQHVISDEAKKARANLQQITPESRQVQKKIQTIDEFNKSVQLLMSIFKESNFDELAIMIAHPTRVFLINFMIGICRGLGFMIGALIIVIFLLSLIKGGTGGQAIEQLLKLWKP